MMNYYESFLIYSGERFSIFFHAETKGLSDVHQYFEDCDYLTQASLLNLVKRIADTGTIYDDTKFRIEDKQHKIYCFKPKKERFFCFFLKGQRIIITSGHTKQKQKLDYKELQKAIRIKEQYK